MVFLDIFLYDNKKNKGGSVMKRNIFALILCLLLFITPTVTAASSPEDAGIAPCFFFEDAHECY